MDRNDKVFLRYYIKSLIDLKILCIVCIKKIKKVSHPDEIQNIIMIYIIILSSFEEDIIYIYYQFASYSA